MLVNCKINLGLQILRKREDGFHDIRTVFYPTDFFTDELILETTGENFVFTCQSEEELGEEDNNLCVQAFRLLQTDYGIDGVHLHLVKGIPTGAGLGGGSADAAFTLKLLVNHFHLPVSETQLMGYAARLGSDVPFFLYNVPMYATGRGEILEPIPLSLERYRIEIVKPNCSVSTRDAYAGVSLKQPILDVYDIIKQPVSHWRQLLHNDFEESIFPKYPILQEIKEELYQRGAVYAAMSGSGTALYGLFLNE